ncbi:MAG: hypothetical protein JSW39_03030 [Desulfobacterales bacterium]|nr:MAG: hypothetical protein JSW39_03030 [Desulfobacterales bacterium]
MNEIGRLLWLILAAAGETDIGEEPSIEAAAGVRLTAAGLRAFLAEGSEWIGTNAGMIPVDGGTSLAISLLQDGTLTLSLNGELKISGRWQIDQEKLYFQFADTEEYAFVVLDGPTVKLFDSTGTLAGKYQINPD